MASTLEIVPVVTSVVVVCLGVAVVEHRVVVAVVGLWVRVQSQTPVLPLIGVGLARVVLVGVASVRKLGPVVVTLVSGRVHAFSVVMLPGAVAMGVVLIRVRLVDWVVVRHMRMMVVREIGVLRAHWPRGFKLRV